MCSGFSFFRKARCCFATCFCWFRFPPFVFLRGVFVIGISRISVWLLDLELFIFFGRRGAVLRRVFVGFVFLLLFFFERRVCYWNKSCFGLAFWVWNYLFFRKASCCFATCLCWFRFPSFVFFLRDVFVIGLSRVSVWSFWVWNYLVFGRRGVVLRRVFVAFVFLLLFFWKGMFVIGISRVSVWSNGLGRKSKFCCATPFCCFCFVMFVLKNC